MSDIHISVVSPVYRGEKMLSQLVDRITRAVATITGSYEIILVNDASPDASWDAIVRACASDSHVKGINLSRNFGQHYAITAGLRYAKGDWVVVMDCDLQDRPEEIPRLYAKAQEGWDVVKARRINKQFGFFKKQSSLLYHKIFDWLSGQRTDPAIGNFGIYSHSVIAEVNKMTEVARSFPTLLNFVGFSSTTLDVQHAVRAEGNSSYSFRKLLKLGFDTAISNTNKPLKLSVALGLIMSAVSLLLAFYNVIAKFVGIIRLAGYTSTLFSIWFVGGLVLFILGTVGLYVGKIYEQTKGRPLFVIKETLNIDNTEQYEH